MLLFVIKFLTTVFILFSLVKNLAMYKWLTKLFLRFSVSIELNMALYYMCVCPLALVKLLSLPLIAHMAKHMLYMHMENIIVMQEATGLLHGNNTSSVVQLRCLQYCHYCQNPSWISFYNKLTISSS